jgi:glycine cleavage system H lipoate-binding protein/NAD-dependent dihydropyrimidine dehydrogenase PreA subunit
MVRLTIDDKSVQIEDGKTILDAAKKLGVKIPTLCYHSEVTSYGACRLCQVEVTKGKRTRLVVSCLYPVEEGLSVKTQTERIIQNRKLIIELLLARSPEVKAIQDLAKEYGIKTPRFRLKKERCILCGLCVRVCSEILGANAIGFAGRGTSKHIAVPFKETPEDCLGCGACTYVCPTGAIQMETEARKRWALYLAAGDRECRYSKMDLVSHKVCPNAFQCQRCEVDQRMEDTFGIHPAFVARPVSKQQAIQIDQFQIMPNRYYTTSHIWVKPLNGKFRVGIDDFTAKFVGRVDDIKIEPTLHANRPAWTLSAYQRELQMFPSFDGKMVEVNPLIRFVPSLLAKDPYQQGWLFIADIENRDEIFNRLLTPTQATKVVKQHSNMLQSWCSKKLGITILDGRGNLVSDIPNWLTHEEWTILIKEFFNTH